MYEFRLALLDEIIPLRHKTLRNGRPIETAFFSEDRELETNHFGLFDESGEIICCLTLIPNVYKNQEAWQLRGMATRQDLQGKGIGKRLVDESIQFVQNKKIKKLIWCNARESAVKFYENLGWKIDSERFDINPIGPHFKMIKEL